INSPLFSLCLDKTMEPNVRYRLVVELAPKLRRWPENIVLISNALWTLVHVLSTFDDTKNQAVGMGIITSIHECLDQFPYEHYSSFFSFCSSFFLPLCLSLLYLLFIMKAMIL